MGNVCEMGHSDVILENHTASYFKFQILHQYTRTEIDDSGYVLFAPGESKKMMNVRYWYGTGTTGIDNWKIHGIQMIDITGTASIGNVIQVNGIDVAIDNTCDINGRVFADGLHWKSWHGFLADWKGYSLNAADNGYPLTIKVYQSTIEFRSPSGSTDTHWDDPVSSIGRLM